MTTETRRKLDELRAELHLCYENGECTDPERAMNIHKRIEREQRAYYEEEARRQDEDSLRRAEEKSDD